MAKAESFRRFEECDAWQIARELTKVVYSLTKGESFRKDFGLVDQIRRAAVSAMSNIAEGSERGTNKDYVRFLFIARASAGEVRSLLYVALDQEYINQEQFQETYDLCVRSAQVIWGLIQFLRKSSGPVGQVGVLVLTGLCLAAEKLGLPLTLT